MLIQICQFFLLLLSFVNMKFLMIPNECQKNNKHVFQLHVPFSTHCKLFNVFSKYFFLFPSPQLVVQVFYKLFDVHNTPGIYVISVRIKNNIEIYKEFIVSFYCVTSSGEQCLVGFSNRSHTIYVTVFAGFRNVTFKLCKNRL